MTIISSIITYCFPKKFLRSITKRLNELQNFIQLSIENKERKIKHTEQNYIEEYTVEKKEEPIFTTEPEPLSEPLVLTDEIRQFLQYSTFADKDVRISFLLPSRAKNNITFNLEKLLESSLLNSDDPKKSEFIVVIDEDDDIKKYLELKQSYGDRLPLKIIISKQRYGYFDLQKYWKIAFRYISSYSKMFSLCTDDIFINQQGFDSELMLIDQKFSDNVFIVHTTKLNRKRLYGKNHMSEISIHNDYKTIFNALSTDGVPTSYFPFVSRAFYEEGKKLQDSGAVRDNWCYILNCYSNDWYTSMLGDFISEQGLEDRVLFKDNFIVRDMRTEADHHIKLDEYGFPVWKYLFQTIFEQSTIEHLKLIAVAVKNRTA